MEGAFIDPSKKSQAQMSSLHEQNTGEPAASLTAIF
jgi:hypothetical protein